MKVLILAGGYGTRLSEETVLKPKPMVEIGPHPILWHIMKLYSHYGMDEFVILLGYKGYIIKEYFANYFLHQSNVTFDMKDNSMKVHNSNSEPWKVTLVDTGVKTMTGGRIEKVKEYIGNETFLLTYGDGVADVNIEESIKFHKEQKAVVTMTAVQPDGRFGAIDIDDNGKVVSFLEKPKGDGAWINGGFFVCEPEALNYIKDGSSTVWEKNPLETIACDGKLSSFRHKGFWQCMDTLREKELLENLWETGAAPWKVWK